jgi:glutamate 5-kinase
MVRLWRRAGQSIVENGDKLRHFARQRVENAFGKGGQRAPPSGQRAPPSGQRTPPSGQRAPPSGQRTPPSGQRAPPSGQRAPPSGQRTPPGTHRAAASTPRTLAEDRAEPAWPPVRAIAAYDPVLIMKKKLVLKIGTSTLTSGTKLISRGKIEDIGRQILELRDEYDIVLVSSGAIAAAKQYINIKDAGKPVESKQAMAAIGQPLLMRTYHEIFSDFGIPTAQCLMTYRDFENETSRQNTLNTINELLKYNYLPIINENDTTSVEEILLGDNDKLSALTATLIKADLLVLASDIDGVFDKNPHIHADAQLIREIRNIDEARGGDDLSAGRDSYVDR